MCVGSQAVGFFEKVRSGKEAEVCLWPFDPTEL